MNWRVVIRPEVELDVAEAAAWYESRQAGLGMEFVEEIIRVWDALAQKALLTKLDKGELQLADVQSKTKELFDAELSKLN